jgi:glycosyltransferase involved in cell wall biosynthesis
MMMCATSPERWLGQGSASAPINLPCAPLVTIITVVYNAGNDLAATIDGIGQQTYPCIEYIVIDGNSTDNTAEIIKHYASVITTLVREPDRGVYDAMNKGVKLAQGQIIGFLNAGDYYRPGAIAAVVAAYQQHGQPQERVNDCLLIAAGLEVITHSGLHYLKQPNRLTMDRDLSLPHPSLFVTKAVFERFGLFADHYTIAADYDFVLRTYQQCQILLLPEVTTVMAPLGLSRDLWLTATEAHQARLANGVSFGISYLYLWLKRLRIVLHYLLEGLGWWPFFEKIGKQKI